MLGRRLRPARRLRLKSGRDFRLKLSVMPGRPHGPSRAASQRREKSVVEQITGSSAFKQFARTAGTEIVRSIFGTARRRR